MELSWSILVQDTILPTVAYLVYALSEVSAFLCECRVFVLRQHLGLRRQLQSSCQCSTLNTASRNGGDDFIYVP